MQHLIIDDNIEFLLMILFFRHDGNIGKVPDAGHYATGIVFLDQHHEKVLP